MKIKRGYLKAFNREKRVLQMFGVYPVKSSQIKYSLLRFIICFAVNSIQLYLMIMLLVTKDISNFLEAWHFIIITIIVLFKISFLVLASTDMEDVEDYLNNFDTVDIPHGIVNYVIGEAYFRNRLYLPQWTTVVSAVTFQFSACLIFHNLGLVLFISWSPFNLQQPTYYYITLIFQVVVFFSNGMPNVTIDTMYYILVDVACCEIDVLMYKLSNLDPLKNPNETLKELKEYVVCHQKILRYITLIQRNVYSKLMFLQCIGSIMVICVLGFQFTMTVNWFLFIQHATYFSSMIFQIFGYTWFGQKFMGKSQEITQACYMSRWYECDIRIQKMLLNIMTRTKKPLVLSSYIFDLTLETFIGVLKSSYSYMALLRTMYTK
uniref:Odorant receptor n=1 Tax=Pyrrhalta maculicollis TaxID=226885 RepID=A0A1J0KKI3_9CUCU|nr:odorant receptor 12 [Pyrrhalta maculicollis]